MSFYQGGELGLSGKLKRDAILEKYGSIVGSMFAQEPFQNSGLTVYGASVIKCHPASHLSFVSKIDEPSTCNNVLSVCL